MYFSQICNGVLLPFVLLMMLRMVNDKNLMGEHTNGLVLNVISYLTVLLVILMTLASIVVPFFAVSPVRECTDSGRLSSGVGALLLPEGPSNMKRGASACPMKGVSHARHSEDDLNRSHAIAGVRTRLLD